MARGSSTFKSANGVKNGKNVNSGPLDFEAKLWAAADALRNNMDAVDVVLGLIFLKYISDAFEDKHAERNAGRSKHRFGGPGLRELLRHTAQRHSRRTLRDCERRYTVAEAAFQPPARHRLHQHLPH